VCESSPGTRNPPSAGARARNRNVIEAFADPAQNFIAPPRPGRTKSGVFINFNSASLYLLSGRNNSSPSCGPVACPLTGDLYRILRLVLRQILLLPRSYQPSYSPRYTSPVFSNSSCIAAPSLCARLAGANEIVVRDARAWRMSPGTPAHSGRHCAASCRARPLSPHLRRHVRPCR